MTNTTLPVAVYGCETWSLTLRKERRLRVFENRVLRRIFGSKRDKVTGEWRKLHNEKLNDLYSSPNVTWVIQMENETGGTCSTYEDRRIQGSVAKPVGKRPLGRTRRRWEDAIKMILQEVGCCGTYWIELAQDRGRGRALVKAVMSLRVP